jgi:hypothetical protein
LPNIIGRPPNCRPECTFDRDCPSNLACLQQRCKDPCPGSCGQNAICSVINHKAICTCIAGYTGDPFVACNVEQSKKKCLLTDWNFELSN